MATRPKLVTAEEFIELPDDGTFQELIRGEVCSMPPPGGRHAKMQDWLRAGASLGWVLYPDTSSVAVHRTGFEVRTLGPDDELDGGDVLPGFRCVVRLLFPE